MDNNNQERNVIEATSLRGWLHDELNGVFERRCEEPSDDVRAYLVNLLYHFSRSDRFFEWHQEQLTIRPLALLYGEALQARSLHERRQMLRRLGDIALFIAGVFGPSLERKVVGVDYYVSMGGGAYDWLSDSLARSQVDAMHSQTFAELAGRFAALVEALDDFALGCGLRGQWEEPRPGTIRPTGAWQH